VALAHGQFSFVGKNTQLVRTAAGCIIGSTRAEKMVIYNNQVVLFVQNAHPLPMAKTWISKRDVKAEKAFIKAMRLLSPKAGRRQFSRPR
jgi:hypothetical protein